MNRIITILFVSSFLPITALAIVCSTTDTQCRQLEALRSSGIKPTAIQEAEKSSPTIQVTQPTQPKSFEVPNPIIKPKPIVKPNTSATTDAANENKSPNTLTQEYNMSKPINIYSPHQQNTMQPEPEQPTTKNKTESKPYTIPKPAPLRMQYR